MPPRTVKRGGAASGQKRTPRSSKKAQSQQDAPVEEPVKVEEVKEEVVVVEEDSSVLEKKPEVEEKPHVAKPVVEERGEPEVARANGSVPLMKEDEMRESIDEYGKDERMDLEDNDPEYEPEEYDDKEMEQEDVHYMTVEGEEEHEEEHLIGEWRESMSEPEEPRTRRRAGPPSLSWCCAASKPSRLELDRVPLVTHVPEQQTSPVPARYDITPYVAATGCPP